MLPQRGGCFGEQPCPSWDGGYKHGAGSYISSRFVLSLGLCPGYEGLGNDSSASCGGSLMVGDSSSSVEVRYMLKKSPKVRSHGSGSFPAGRLWCGEPRVGQDG